MDVQIQEVTVFSEGELSVTQLTSGRDDIGGDSKQTSSDEHTHTYTDTRALAYTHTRTLVQTYTHTDS